MPVIERIYADSFPPEERTPFEQLAAGIADGRRVLYVAHEGGEARAFGTVIELEPAPADLLEYMASAREARGRGIGGAMLGFIRGDRSANPGNGWLLMEVEPLDQGAEEERGRRRRRQKFFRRAGVTKVECAPEYEIPRQSGKGTVRMDLQWLPLRGAPDVPGGPGLARAVEAIFERKYGLPPGSEHARNQLRALV